MKFIEQGFEMSKAMVTALASIRNTKKGAHPACRLWYWDPGRTVLYVVGESMVLRCIGDIVEFAENEPNPYPFDVEILRKRVLPHVQKGTLVRVVARDGLVAEVVQEDPLDVLTTTPLDHQGCGAPPPSSMFDAAIPSDRSAAEHGCSPWAEISPYLQFSHLDSIAKVSKVLKASAVRIQPPDPGDPDGSPTVAPVRVDIALPTEQGRWTAMLMPVVVSS